MIGLPSRLQNLQSALVDAEAKLRLLDSLLPQNFLSERARLLESYRRGRPALPEFRFDPASGSVRRADGVSTTLSAARIFVSDPAFRGGVPAEMVSLFEERLDELELETRMVRACGAMGFVDLAERRFALGETELSQSEALASRWLAEPVPSAEDSGDILLASALEKRRKGLGPVGEKFVVMERELASLCGVARGCLYVRKGARVSAFEAERLWVHEVEGHLLPRLRAETAPPPFALGTPGCVVDEEGWAVWLEDERGMLGGRRKRELAARFHLALCLRRGGTEGLREGVALALERGTAPEGLAGTICRLLRGGGLARESVYLPGYLRVREALKREPAHRHYFERGRVSVAALPRLLALFPREG